MQTDETTPLTLTISQAAKLLRWSRGKIYNHIRHGWIRTHKRGTRVHIITEELFEDLKK